MSVASQGGTWRMCMAQSGLQPMVVRAVYVGEPTKAMGGSESQSSFHYPKNQLRKSSFF